MAKKTFPLVDVGQDLWIREATFGPSDLPGPAGPWSVRKRTLAGGLRDGVETVEIVCGALRVILLPTRGMGIWKVWWRDLEIAWQSPNRHGPVHPKFVPLMEPSGLGWLAGFDELLCRCGLESNGAPEWSEREQLLWPLHGRIANLPAHELSVTVDSDAGAVSVRGVVDEVRLFGSKLRLVSTTSVRADEPVVHVHDEVVNLSAEPGELELLYHVNFGAPLLAPGARLIVPAQEVSPRDPRAAGRGKEWESYGPPEPGRREEVHFMELFAGADGRTRALLAGPEGKLGVSLVYDTRQLPCFSQWKNPQMPADGCVTGLEPGTNFPNQRRFEKLRKRVVPLGAGERKSFDLDLEIHPDPESVERARRDVERIAAGRKPRVHPAPDPRFAPL